MLTRFHASCLCFTSYASCIGKNKESNDESAYNFMCGGQAPCFADVAMSFTTRRIQDCNNDWWKGSPGFVRYGDIAPTLVDQKDSELDSVWILEQVKEINSHTRRILLSSHTPVQIIIDVINGGEICHFITKPWNNEAPKLIAKETLERYDLILEKDHLLDIIAERNQKLQQMNARLAQQYEERS